MLAPHRCDVLLAGWIWDDADGGESNQQPEINEIIDKQAQDAFPFYYYCIPVC